MSKYLCSLYETAYWHEHDPRCGGFFSSFSFPPAELERDFGKRQLRARACRVSWEDKLGGAPRGRGVANVNAGKLSDNKKEHAEFPWTRNR